LLYDRFYVRLYYRQVVALYTYDAASVFFPHIGIFYGFLQKFGIRIHVNRKEQKLGFLRYAEEGLTVYVVLQVDVQLLGIFYTFLILKEYGAGFDLIGGSQ